MEFKELLEALKSGKRIARAEWKEKQYLQNIDGTIKVFIDACSNFYWIGDDILKNNWQIIEGNTHTFESDFSEIIKALNEGKKVKQPDWQDKYIILDRNTRDVILKHFIFHGFNPVWSEINANDWYIME